jgi:hypothetical protein
MRLVRPIAVALVSVLAAGCSDATAPPTRVTALYLLESIDDQPLPATFAVNPIETATVSWGTLNLDAEGNATLVERRRSEFATSQHERTIAQITDYEISGETIMVGPPCLHDPLADCVPKRIGEITASTLTLKEAVLDAPVYLYRLAVTN